MRVEVAAGVLTGAWLLGVSSVWWLAGRDIPLADSATFSVTGQIERPRGRRQPPPPSLATRRDRFATLEAFR